MLGRYSKKKFFKEYPDLIKTWFQGTQTTSSKEIENLFKIAEKKADFNKNSNDFYGEINPISLVFFDEIGLAEYSESNPLKILHFKFEYKNEKELLSFVGISNWSLDAAKMNRGFTLSVPEIHEKKNDTDKTCEDIVKSINNNLLLNEEYKSIFDSLGYSYFHYKQNINDIDKKKKEENYSDFLSLDPLCHGSRDFYYLIKNVAYSFNDLLKEKIDYKIEDEIKIVNNAIDRNFGSFKIEGKDSDDYFKNLYEEKRKIKFKRKKNVIDSIISNINDKKARN